MAERKYKAVFLDWDNTIGDFTHSAEHALQDLYVKYNLSRFYPSFDTYFTIYEAHNLYLWDLYGEDKISKEQLQLERFCYPLQQSEICRMGKDSLEMLARQIGDDFCRLTTDYFSLMPYAAEVVPLLAERYPLTIISNGFIEVQYQKIDRSGLRPYFQHIVLSEEVGIQKPQPAIYEQALALNGLHADEVVMIGDSFSSDIAGAKGVGIDQIWIRDTDNALPDGQSATWVVRNLQEAAEQLGICNV